MQTRYSIVLIVDNQVGVWRVPAAVFTEGVEMGYRYSKEPNHFSFIGLYDRLDGKLLLEFNGHFAYDQNGVGKDRTGKILKFI